jgi:hypothetical protein
MKKSVSKLVVVMIVLLGISGCSSNSMSPEAKAKINHQTGFNIENIHVKLIKNPFFSEDEKHALYMSTAELDKGGGRLTPPGPFLPIISISYIFFSNWRCVYGLL